MVPSKGRLWGVGVGPGDPELVTLKAARLIRDADVIAYHSARHGRSIARSVAASQLRGDQIEEALVYPVTTETTSHPGGYRGAIDEFYEDCAKRLAVHLDAGRDVVVLSEGDPFFYGSFIHLHRRLADRYPTEVVPGVTSLSAGCAVLGRPLVEGNEVLTVLPGTLPPTVLAERIAGTDTAVVLKMGRTFPGVRDAFTAAGRLADTWYVERATTSGQRIAPLGAVDPATVPYFSLAVLPSPVRGPDDPAPLRASQAGWVPTAPTVGKAGAVGTGGTPGAGEVVVVGLGPGAAGWLTPQAAEALAAADDLIGYGPYLDRVPVDQRQRRHASGNTVEAERAELALELAAGGANVAVVSSGDPGVFAMATAVVEAAAAERFAGVEVRVVPGLTAAQAVASRVGAPLGHDFCVLSLSDRLKPWEVIERRLRAAAAGDFVLALYNPASRTRRHQLERAHEVLLEHRPSDTVVVIGRDVGGPTESITVTSLGAFDPAEVDMRCLLLIGSSTTRVVRRGPGRDLVFTPRRYPVT
ncbi:precorrin-3 methyltransferase [Frankia casuarinae]|uniref:Cobalt-factor II C20-methyltransferase / precorrin-2 C20-methyltransferase n=1 Tax=Frankia casuarinae (strain DSM 45818 / CECT 9043 / HFP020203 / CcI3) TaxID=106370 RepID=Q2JCU5_FRACC|nr:precorrin-2 C(20)-methyltransferase [Frankia casuarinae]ABD10897.1 cobalt-factor II C20-methyltransferase / precorrin-2 C20-methyltransferase [Frankia casuarinae]EYT90238.1 precorrin-3 methyltransferase [Frankia casuarinae]